MSILLEMKYGLGHLLEASIVAFRVPIDSVFHASVWRISVVTTAVCDLYEFKTGACLCYCWLHFFSS